MENGRVAFYVIEGTGRKETIAKTLFGDLIQIEGVYRRYECVEHSSIYDIDVWESLGARRGVEVMRDFSITKEAKDVEEVA